MTIRMSSRGAKSTLARDPIELRACGSTYRIICIPSSLFVILYLYVYLASGDLVGLIVTIVLFVIAIHVASSYRVQLSLSGIQYRGPFFRRGAVPWTALARVITGVSVKPTSRRPPYHMAFIAHDQSVLFVVNIKVYCCEDLATLVTYIKEQAPAALLDPATEALARGTVSSIFRSSSRTRF